MALFRTSDNKSDAGVKVSVFACVIVGAVPLLQPLLLGELARLDRITTVQIGQAATCETLGMALTTLLGALFLSSFSLRKIGAVCGFAIAAMNLATAQASGEGVLLCRFLAGAFGGILIWIFWATMAQQKSAARWTAAYVVLEACFSGALGLLFSLVVAPRLGPSGAYFILALLGAAAGLAFALGGPRGAKSEARGKIPLPNLAGLIGILAVSCHLGGIFAFWVYAPLVATSGGVALQTAQVIISLSVFGHIIGGAMAFLVAPRIRPETALCIALLGAAGAISLMLIDGTWFFAVATLTLAVFWLFSPPFHMGLLLTLDDTGHSAGLIGTAQLTGVSIGPLLSSLAINSLGPVAATTVGLSMLAASFVLGAIALTMKRVSADRRKSPVASNG